MKENKSIVGYRWWRWIRVFIIYVTIFSVITGTGIILLWKMPPENLAEGIFWQPNQTYLKPEGNWNQIGVHVLVVQWTVTNGRAWFPNKRIPQWKPQVDWSRILKSLWAKKIIVGLAGDFKVPRARKHARELAALSDNIVNSVPIKNPLAWYAPVEVSPGWHNIHAIKTYLASLPRPLWVSIYGGNEMTPAALVSWVRSWLPEGVGVLYQDGVGVGSETPAQAAIRVRALETAFGCSHVGIILEAFKQNPNGQFVSASVWRIAEQLRAYKGLHIYFFSALNLGTYEVIMLKLLGLLGLA